MRAAALAVLALGAITPTLDPKSIDEALTIANSSFESSHRRFHADYRFQLNTPPVDFISIVSPFRRVVLAAESAVRLGARMFGQREALAALQPDPDRLEIFVELTFHPLNTLVGVPAYTIELAPLSFIAPVVAPAELERLPRFTQRVDEARYPFPYPYRVAPKVPTAPSQPLVGGTLLARYSMGQIDPKGVYAVVVKEEKKELARAKVDFLRLR
jgi:hypothetical protein